MDTLRDLSPRALVFLSVLAILGATVASAQEAGAPDERSLTASIEVSQVFDDNLFDQEDDANTGFLTYIRPQYDLNLPFRLGLFKLSAGFPIYYHWNDDRGSDVLYNVSTSLTTTQAGGFNVTIQDRLVPVAVSIGGTDVEESDKNKIQSNNFSASPGFTFPVASRSTMTIRYIFGMTHYFKEHIGQNFFQHSARISSRTALTGRLELGVQYTFVVRDLMELDIMRLSHEAQVSLSYVWTRLTITVGAGASYLTFRGDDLDEDEDEQAIGEYVAGRISWRATEWLTLNLAYTRVLTDDVYTNTYFAQDGRLGLDFPVASWVLISLGVFVRDYRSETQLQRSDTVFGGDANVRFMLFEGLYLSLGYRYNQNLGAEDRNDFSNHIGVVGLKYTF